MEHKITERHRRGKISDNTRKNHTSTLNELKRFRQSVPFYSLDVDFADDFNAHLEKHVRGLNTRWGRHKDVKTYLEHARKDKIKFEHPYADFKNKSEPGKWLPLQPEEHDKLRAYYSMCASGTPHRRILAKFLFSCSSSLRLGDLKAIGEAKLQGSELVFQIEKTFSKKQKEMLLPLTNRALQYLKDAQLEEGIQGFYNYTDQYENRVLTAIGQQLGIATRLHHHVGRETFATDFIRRGGPVEVLQKLLDHTNIRDTMKYVHVNADMKRAAIQRMNELESEPHLLIV
jgi:site-specific recombinase XerD